MHLIVTVEEFANGTYKCLYCGGDPAEAEKAKEGSIARGEAKNVGVYHPHPTSLRFPADEKATLAARALASKTAAEAEANRKKSEVEAKRTKAKQLQAEAKAIEAELAKTPA